MAPEQAERGSGVDYRADLYSLGATLFRLLTGRPPLAAAPDMTPLEKLRLLSTHSAPRLQTLRPDVPDGLSELVANLLARDPAHRPASASHAAELLAEFCDDPQLAELLQRARANNTADTPTPSQPVRLRSSARADGAIQNNPAQHENADSPQSAASRIGGTSKWWPRIAAASLAVAAIAGIVFIVETSKGQLVIDSLDANVTLQIRKDNVVLDELKIEPGTHSTRLWGGKYEITLDAGSDNFTISNESFTVRRGDTVVARITTKPTHGAKPTNIESPALGERSLQSSALSAQPERLEEISYDGETLATWLHRLKYEKSKQQQELAIIAIKVLATPELREELEAPLLEFAINQFRTKDLNNLDNAFAALGRACGTDVFRVLQPVFNIAKTPLQIQVLAHHLSRSDSLFAGVSESDIAPLSAWLRDAPITPDIQNMPSVLLLFRSMMSMDSNMDSLAARQVAMELLATRAQQSTELEAYLYEWVWFPEPESSRNIWPADTRNTAFRLGTKLLADETTNPSLRAKATMVILSLALHGYTPAPDARQDLISTINQLLAKTSAEPAHLQWTFSPVRNFQSLAKYRVDGSISQDFGHSPAYLLPVVLNIVQSLNMVDDCRGPLKNVHDKFSELPIADQPSYYYIPQAEPAKYSQVIYLRTGELLAVPEEQLSARVKGLRPVDHAHLTHTALTMLKGPSSKQKEAIQILDNHMASSGSEEAAAALTEFLASPELPKLPDVYPANLVRLLCRAAGKEFFKHFAAALDATATPSVLLNVDFSTLPEFSCESPDSITPLLKWTHQVCRSDAMDDPLRDLAINMVSSLVIDRSQLVNNEKLPATSMARPSGLISYEVQTNIIEHLEAYPTVTDADFWFQEPYASRVSPGLTKTRAMGEAMVRRATTLLEKGSTDSLECRALVCIKSFLASGETLQAAEKTSLINIIERRLAEAASDFGRALEFVLVPSSMIGWTRPGISGIADTHLSSTYDRANRVLLLLDVIEALKCQQQLAAPLNAIFEQAHAFELYRDVIRTNRMWVDLAGGRGSKDVAIQTILVRTGVLLRKDADELLQLPNQRFVARAEKARKTANSGDTLAIYIENILPARGAPLPVMQAGNDNPVVGYPVPVSPSGEIVLPLLPPMQVNGLDLSEVQKQLAEAYGKLYSEPPTLSVNMLAKADSGVELRSLSSPTTTQPPASNEAKR